MTSAFRVAVSFRFLPLVLILVNQAEGQGGLMQDFWEFAASTGAIDSTISSDPGKFPPDSELFPPINEPFPPEVGILPLDSGSFPKNTGASKDSGAFPPNSMIGQEPRVVQPKSDVMAQNSGAIPQATDVFPQDTSVVPQEPSVVQHSTNEHTGNSVKVDSTFISEAQFKQEMQGTSKANHVINPITTSAGEPGLPVIQNTNLGSNILPPVDPTLLSQKKDTVVPLSAAVDPFGVGSGKAGVDSSFPSKVLPNMPTASISIGVESVAVAVKPIVHSEGTKGTAQFGQTGHIDKNNIIRPGSNKQKVSKVIVPVDIINPASKPVADAVKKVALQPIVTSNVGAPAERSIVLPTSTSLHDPKSDAGILSSAVGQHIDSQILSPTKAQAFLNSLIGESFMSVGDKPRPQPEKAVPVDQWAQLYPGGQRPDRIEAGLARLEPVTEGTPLSENAKQMAEIAAGSFGKHRNLYKLLREERIQKKKQKRNQQNQLDTMSTSLELKKPQAGALLIIPMGNKQPMTLFVPDQSTNKGHGNRREKRQASKCNRGRQKKGLCSLDATAVGNGSMGKGPGNGGQGNGQGNGGQGNGQGNGQGKGNGKQKTKKPKKGKMVGGMTPVDLGPVPLGGPSFPDPTTGDLGGLPLGGQSIAGPFTDTWVVEEVGGLNIVWKK